MPPVRVQGQPVANRTITQPPLEDIKEAIPEPAKTAADHIPPTQDELAELSLKQQTIAKETMTPSHEAPAYKFTDSDRAKALASRLAERYNWEDEPIDDALSYLALIRAECERGGLILQKRVSELKVEKVKCFGCENIIDLSQGRWATSRTRNNFETGIPETAYACSAACGLKLNRDFTHPTRQAAIPVER